MQNDPKQDDKKPEVPEVKDVEPGSDADETPTPKVGKTPANPNNKPAT